MDHEFAGDRAGNLKYQHSSGGSAYSGSRNNRGLRQKIKDRDHHFSRIRLDTGSSWRPGGGCRPDHAS